MILETITIKNFRSIESAALLKCGAFNVLIGKNNSGKSNILWAIHAFFDCIDDAGVVKLRPPIGKPIDHFGHRETESIDITSVFRLTLAHRDSLIQRIISDAPQLKNAVEGLDPSLRLSVTVSIPPRRPPFGIVSGIAFVRPPGTEENHTERTLLKIRDEAAIELRDIAARIQEVSDDGDWLGHLATRFDQDDWERIRSAGVSGSAKRARDERRPPMLFMFRRYFSVPEHIGAATTHTLEEMLTEENSYSAFSRALDSYRSSQQNEVTQLRQQELKNTIDTFSGQESSIPKYVTSILTDLSKVNVHYLRDRRKAIGKDEANRLLDLKVRRGGEEALQNIQNTVSSLLGVKIDAFQAGKSSEQGTDAELDVDNFLVEVNGSGIREALRLVLDVEFEKPDMVLVEEPEMHLHPALETSMMRYLKRVSASCQVFLTTHSTNFLDTAEMNNVYLVGKSDSTQIQTLDFEEAESQIPKELGLKLSSLFMYDRLVFVEGAPDESVLREWSAKMGINLSQSNVGFVNMGGARSLSYFAAETTMNFLAKRQVKLWFLIDRDEKGTDEIKRLKDKLGTRASIKVLDKRELENYLICYRPLLEFIKLKRQLAGMSEDDSLPSEAQLRDTVSSAADELREYTIRKRVAHRLCRPLYPQFDPAEELDSDPSDLTELTDALDQQINMVQDAKARVAETYEEERELIENHWTTKKLDLAAGDLILDRVCKKYKLRFKKDRDSIRLAELFQKDEIDQEMQSLIREFGA